MRITVICLSILCLFAFSAYADLYVAIDKTTNEPKGVVHLSKENAVEWGGRFLLIKVDKNYEGMQGYEIKYDGITLRHATQAELNAYFQEQENIMVEYKKQKALEDLGLTEEHLQKIKALK